MPQLQKLADGTFIDWGRHATVNGQRGEGGAVWYRGEAAEVMRLVIKYSEGNPPVAPATATKEGEV